MVSSAWVDRHHSIVAIDSSKFRTVKSRDRNFTPGKVDKRQHQIE